MKTSFACAVVFATLLSACVLPAVAGGERDGSIRFTGSIINASCSATPGERGVLLGCYRGGSDKIARATYARLAGGRPLHADIASVSLRYGNPQKSRADMVVEYN